MKKLFKTFLTIVIIFALVIIFTFAVVSIRMTGQVKALNKTNIDLSQVADGVYTGHSITNLGRAESNTIREGVFIPPASPVNRKAWGVLTINNKMMSLENLYGSGDHNRFPGFFVL